MNPALTAPQPTVPVIKPTNVALPVVVLSQCETIKVVTAAGRPLLEISCDAQGPSIRLSQDNLRIECPGQLDFAAETIRIEASNDVAVKGRTIRLN